MSIRLFRFKEESFWRLWPVRPLECNVPTNCKRGVERAVDRWEVCLTFSPTSSSSCSFWLLETWLWFFTLPVHLIYSVVTCFPKPEIAAMGMFLGYQFQVVFEVLYEIL
jgi:hypothetical protein